MSSNPPATWVATSLEYYSPDAGWYLIRRTHGGTWQAAHAVRKGDPWDVFAQGFETPETAVSHCLADMNERRVEAESLPSDIDW